MIRKHIPKDIVQNIVTCSKSYSAVSKNLNKLLNINISSKTIKRLLIKLNIDTSHFTGKNWNKGIKTGSIVPIEDYFSRKKINPI